MVDLVFRYQRLIKTNLGHSQALPERASYFRLAIYSSSLSYPRQPSFSRYSDWAPTTLVGPSLPWLVLIAF